MSSSAVKLEYQVHTPIAQHYAEAISKVVTDQTW